MVQITRRYEIDAGHRVPGHGGKCRHLHGHRYVVEATAAGPVAPDGLEGESGMVLDFGGLKEALAVVVGPCDHRLLLWRDDPIVQPLIAAVHDDDTGRMLLPVVPTAERLAELWGEAVASMLIRPVQLVRLRVYETPNCWADWRNPNVAYANPEVVPCG